MRGVSFLFPPLFYLVFLGSSGKGRRANGTSSREGSIGLNEKVRPYRRGRVPGRCFECGIELPGRRRHRSLCGQGLDVDARDSMVA
jgi:hypothetical protein